MTARSATLVAGLPTSINLRAVDATAREIIRDLLTGKVERELADYIRGLLVHGKVPVANAPAKPKRTRAKAAAGSCGDCRGTGADPARPAMRCSACDGAGTAPVELPELDKPGIVFASVKALLRQVERAALVRRTTVPILSNVKLVAFANGMASITGTDLDMHVVAELQAGRVRLPKPKPERGYCIDPDGGYCWYAVEPPPTNVVLTLPARGLVALLKKLPDGPVVIEPDGKITAGAATAKLAALPADEFPAVEFKSRGYMRIAPDELASVIATVAFAISTEETRYYLNGIFLHADPDAPDASGEHFRMVTTDGHRLAARRFRVHSASLPAAEPVTYDRTGAIIPRQAVRVMQRLLPHVTGGVQLKFGKGYGKECMQFQAGLAEGVVTMTSRLIDGTFPDYQRVIPSGCDKAFSVDCAAFAKAIERAMVVSTDKSRAVKLTVNGAGGMTITCVSPEGGQTTIPADCSTEGMPADSVFEVGYNARYLLDLCDRAKRLTFRVSDAASPALVLDPDNDRVLFVQMPLRV